MSALEQSNASPIRVNTISVGLPTFDLTSKTTSTLAVTATVTVFDKSALVWIGVTSTTPTPKSALPVMGPLTVSFPKTFDNSPLPPFTQLLGSSSSSEAEGLEEGETAGNMIASRLAKATKWPIFVTTSLRPPSGVQMGGEEERAIAGAKRTCERQVAEYLKSLSSEAENTNTNHII